MHNHCFRCYMLCNALLHAINVKFGPPSENYSSPLVSQAGYGSAGDCCYATRFSLFTIKFFRFNIKFITEINVKRFIQELYMHNYTKIYLRLNRNQNEQRWIGK